MRLTVRRNLYRQAYYAWRRIITVINTSHGETHFQTAFLFGFQGTRAEVPLHYLTVSTIENGPLFAKEVKTFQKDGKGNKKSVSS